MSHPEFKIEIRIKGKSPSAKELLLIRKFDDEVTEVPATILKNRLEENGVHRINGLVMPYLSDILAVLEEHGINYIVK